MTYIIVFFTGCVTNFLVIFFLKKKAVIINASQLKIAHYVQGHLFVCTGLLFDIQFVNLFFKPILIKKCRARLYDGEKYIYLSFEGYAVSPADVIGRNAVKVLSFSLSTPYMRIELPIPQLHSGEVFLEFSYHLQNTRKIFLIPAKEFIFNESVHGEKHFYPN